METDLLSLDAPTAVETGKELRKHATPLNGVIVERWTSLKAEVEKALGEIRPNLQADGGDIELVDVANDVVKVRLKGSCAGCPMSQMTLQWGVENYLKKKVSPSLRVEAV